MDQAPRQRDDVGSALDGVWDRRVLGRLGRELARTFDDTLAAPLPPALQGAMDRLASALADRGRTAATARPDER